MSIIADGAFEKNTMTDEEWNSIKDRFPYNPNAPRPEENNQPSPIPIGLDKFNPKSSSTSTDSLLDEAIQDAKSVRTIALKNAKQALEEAFPEKKNLIKEKIPDVSRDDIIKELLDDTKRRNKAVSEEDIDEIVKELEEESGVQCLCSGKYERGTGKVNEVYGFEILSEKKKTVAETKDLIKNFKEKTANYPMHISYDGSMVLCVLLSLNQNKGINISGLPEEDRTLILKLLPDNAEENLGKYKSKINVEFDKDKDFILTYQEDTKKEPTITINVFNEVIHPVLKSVNTTVPIEKDGENISVGDGKIILNKKFIQKMIGVVPPVKEQKQEIEEDLSPRRQPVSGRNAYELREDILELAVNWTMYKKGIISDDSVISTAKKFYSFVENKNR